MTVLVICEGLGEHGAVANVAWQQALGLSRKRSVCLISDGLTSERQQQLSSCDVQLRLRILKVPDLSWLRRYAHLPRQLMWIMVALWAARRELKSQRTAVICHSHPLAAALAWHFSQRIHIVMVSHGDIFHRPPGSYDPAVTWLYQRTTGYAHRKAHASLALSPEMVSRIQAHGVPPQRIVLISNGLEPAEIGMQDYPSTPAAHWQQKPLQLLFIGRLDQIKGLEVLLEALAIAKKAGCVMHLRVIGSSTKSRSRDLKQLAQHLGIDNLVQWIGPAPRQHLGSHYSQSHIVVVPSIDDPLPTVVLEAMACGRPVIGSAVGGIGFMVVNQETGLLVPPANAHALANALRTASLDSTWLAQAAEKSSERALLFNWDSNIGKLENVLASIP